MKLLLCAYECEPNRGREQGRGWNCAVELAKYGHDVWVLTPLRNQAAIAPVLSAQPVPRLNFVYIEDSELIRRHLKGKKGTILRYFLWQRRAYRIARQLDQEHQFDLVHHVTMGSLTGGSLLWRLGKPFVFGPCGGGQIAPPAFKRYFAGEWQAEALRTFVVKHLIPLNPFLLNTYRHTKLVLAANYDTVHFAKRLGAQRAELFFDAGLPQDYFPDEPPVRSPAPELRLLWVARMFPRKALKLALEAISQVHPSVPIKLTIAGGGDQEKLLPQWLDAYGLEKRVECVGFLSWEAVKDQYLKNDALLFTSLRDTGGAQLLEAMAQGLPIVALNHHGAGDHIPDQAGIKVPVTHPDETVNALTKAITYLYHHPDERVEMGRVGFEYAKTQMWPEKTRQISQFYSEILHQDSSKSAKEMALST
ncbi:MAG: glycosyltransferase family 4 protein [Elainellaceae cyanobacterium]